MKRTWTILLVAFLLLSLFLTGCQTGKDGGSTVSGRVVLEGESSHGGTIVQLFGYGSSEPIWAITSAHACIGFPYSPAADFDWRLQQPLYVTTTDGAGSFAFSDVADGTYIFSARHDSFGWSAPVTAAVQGGDVSLGTVTLFGETFFGFQSLQENTTFLEDHHYVFSGIVNVPENVTLTIQPGAVLRFDQDRWLVVSGTLIADGTPEKWIVWTCRSDTIISAHWNMLQFASTATTPGLSYNRVEGAHQGVNSAKEGGSFDHCFFRKVNAEGLTIAGAGVRVTHCIFLDIGGNGLVANTASNADIQSNLFYRNGFYGLVVFDWNGGAVFNNWFEQCGSEGTGYEGGVHILLSNDVRFTHNEVVRCRHGIYFGSRCDSTNLIQANVFSNLFKGIYVGFTQDNAGASYPSLHYNCMRNLESYCVHVGSCQFNRNHNLQAGQNYWGTTSDAQVNECMWDALDEEGCPFLLINPFLTSCPDSAGITC
ncbi:MAG: right-handed parallel beta-helix repeat-containing protein [Calditrichaeota bacterium]|nr:right-handed parallel beta-helix repeat-containing protein [Calditrichota bacterium]